MKTKLSLLIIFTLLLVGSSFSKSAKKFGMIRYDVIFKEYKGTKEAQDKYDSQMENWQADAEKMRDKLQKMKEQLEKQSLMMSEEKKKLKEKEFQEKYMKYQKFVNDKFSQGGEAQKKNAEFTKPIIKKIQAIVEEIGKKESYDLIFDASAGAVVYAGDNVKDITKRVLKVLNKKYK